MVVVKHYDAVLEAAFHSYTESWLLCSIVMVEHTADDKQMLCQQQRDGYLCRHSTYITRPHNYLERKRNLSGRKMHYYGFESVNMRVRSNALLLW
jgi:hypothetical protein